MYSRIGNSMTENLGSDLNLKMDVCTFIGIMHYKHWVLKWLKFWTNLWIKGSIHLKLGCIPKICISVVWYFKHKQILSD